MLATRPGARRLAERADDNGGRCRDAGDAAAARVPGRCVGEAKRGGEAGGDGSGLAAETGTGACRAAELQDGTCLDFMAQADRGFRDAGLPMRDAQAKADRERVLQQGAADGWGGGMAPGEGSERRRDASQVAIQKAARSTNLTSQNGVGDILAGGALVQGLCGVTAQGGTQARHQRDRQRAGERRFLRQFGQIDRDRGAEYGDGLDSLRADQALGRLGAGQLRLEGEGVT